MRSRELQERIPRRVEPRLRWGVALAALALTALLSAPATAQQIVGRVLDGATQEPIEDAVLTLIHPDGPALGDPVRSDGSGAFTLPVPGPGSYYVKVERQDYAGFVDGVFAFDSEDARLEVTVYLLRQPVEVEGVDVTVNQARVRRSLRTNGFYDRLEQGFGDFITPEDIEARGIVSDVSDLFRSIPGVSTYSSLVVMRNQSASTGLVVVNDRGEYESIGFCEPQIWIDGIRLTMASKEMEPLPTELRLRLPPNPRKLEEQDLNMGLDSVIDPNDIAAVEVYRTVSGTPLEWSGLESTCGTIVIWTKRGRDG